jgi:hypothetical protein
MKPLILGLSVCLLCLCGCASRYDITLSNGSVVRTSNKPKLDQQGFYVFKDVSGRELQVNSMRVRQIEPASRRLRTGPFFYESDSLSH